MKNTKSSSACGFNKSLCKKARSLKKRFGPPVLLALICTLLQLLNITIYSFPFLFHKNHLGLFHITGK